MKPKAFNSLLTPMPMILLLGFVLRLYWTITQTPVMPLEGCEYVRMAENLVIGNGLVGLWGDPETMYGPLFPILIAGVAHVIPNVETAAHVVLWVFGTAMIAAVFLIARLMYGQRTAYICALLAAIHPLLVKDSASIYNEPVYMASLLAAVYFGLQALELHRRRDFALCGFCFGLAYLARPEAAAYPVFFALALCVVGLAHRKTTAALLASAILVGSFAVVASPHVAYLYRETGALRLEGKWNINYTSAQRLLLGMNMQEARYGIDKELNVEGPLLQPTKFANYTPYPHSFNDKLRTLLANAKRNWMSIYADFTDNAIGSPVLPVLVVLGLFRSAWSRRRLTHEAVISTMVASVIFLLLTATETGFRYFFPMLPFLLIWAGKGIEELGEWGRGSAVLNSDLLPQSTIVVAGLQVLSIALLFGLSALGTQSLANFTQQTDAHYVAARDAGLWLRQSRPGPKRVAAWISIVPYYAGATMLMWPYADPELTLRYLKSQRADFAVLQNQHGKAPATIDEWIANGIPDESARLIYDSTTSTGGRIVIYSLLNQ